MKMTQIRAVAKPKSFADVKFSQKDWEIASAAGVLTTTWATAMANVRMSKGLYELVPEKKTEVEIKVGGLSVDEMSNAELKLMAVKLGKTIRKKSIMRKDLVRLVQEALDFVEVTEDDDEVEMDDESSGSEE